LDKEAGLTTEPAEESDGLKGKKTKPADRPDDDCKGYARDVEWGRIVIAYSIKQIGNDP
jgi:hypothetical protein